MDDTRLYCLQASISREQRNCTISQAVRTYWEDHFHRAREEYIQTAEFIQSCDEQQSLHGLPGRVSS